MKIEKGYTVWCDGFEHESRQCDSSETVEANSKVGTLRALTEHGWTVRKNKLYCPDHSKQELNNLNQTRRLKKS